MYVCRERERERERYIYMEAHICIYIYIHQIGAPKVWKTIASEGSVKRVGPSFCVVLGGPRLGIQAGDGILATWHFQAQSFQKSLIKEPTLNHIAILNTSWGYIIA